MATSCSSGKLRRLHSITKPVKRGLSEHIVGRSASFQSLQLVFEGAFGDDTAALSKELQQATPRSSLQGGQLSSFVPHDRLDGLLDCMADLSTRAGGSGGDAGDCSDLFGSSEDALPGTPPAQRSPARRRHSGLQEVPVRGADEQSPSSARSSDAGGGFSDWCLPASRQDSMESCGGSMKR